jgi:protein-S-isoprenylcysteine O-methyltransferase Ste14
MPNAFKTILYMGSLHGFFTFYFPFQLASRTAPLVHPGLIGYLAVPFWIFGAAIIVQCSVDIIRRGRGTPAHLDPPRELLMRGWYRHVRNPIYLGAVVVQIGYILWFGPGLVMLYTLLYILGFHMLIVLVEEPVLRRSFGSAYEEYCRSVPRWIPNFK